VENKVNKKPAGIGSHMDYTMLYPRRWQHPDSCHLCHFACYVICYFWAYMKDLSLGLTVLLDIAESVTVSVMLQNPLHISIPLHDVYLLWSFKERSGATAQLICNEMMQETTESPVKTQHLNSVMLKPDCIQEVCIFIHLSTHNISKYVL
jgi:hypothetical protein